MINYRKSDICFQKRLPDFSGGIFNIGKSKAQLFEKGTRVNVTFQDVAGLDEAKVEVMGLLRQTIRPEFLNRVDEIIMFQPLNRKEVRKIIEIQLKGLQHLVKDTGIELHFTPYALDFLAENGYDPQFGARPLKRLIQKEIVNQLSKRILAGDIDKTKPVFVDVFDGVVVFRNEKAQQVV
mgnify:CR=1 FL=1